MKNTILEIPDMDQKNYVIQPYVIGDDTYMFIFRNAFRGNNCIFVDIYQDSFTEANKIYSGLKLTGNSVLCLPNINKNFLYGIRCFNIYDFTTPITPQNCSTQFVLELVPVEETDDYLTEE